jgi:endoribonuclease Dicer
VITFPDMEVYTYSPLTQSNLTVTYNKELDRSKLQVKFCSAIRWIVIVPVDRSLCFVFFVFFFICLSSKQSECILRESLCDFKDSQKKLKSLWRLHENLVFCLQELGSLGALQVSWHCFVIYFRMKYQVSFV